MSVRSFIRCCATVAVLVTGTYSLSANQATFARSTRIANNTPGFVHAAESQNLGPETPSKVIEVSVWLNLHHRARLDTLAQELYDPNSPHFRNWLTHAEFAKQYAPTAAEASQVAEYLTSRGLHVVTVGADNLFVRARGSVAAVSKAFQVALNRYQVKGETYRANSSDPVMEGPTAALVSSVSGMYEYPFGASLLAAPYTATSYTSNCFPGTGTEGITGSPGNYPYALITGNKYASSDTGTGCGYTPPEIQTAYNLKALYKEGFDGTGQTIVIVDWCGSPTIRQDANAFSARYVLPPLTDANFRIIEYPGPSSCSGVNPQINRDVEWAHAVAPGANIALVIAQSPAPQDVDLAEYYAISAQLGNVISGAYGFQEHYQASTEVLNENLLNEIAAVFGISANFPVGDNPSDDFWWVWAPAITPYATAIGGTDLALNKNNSIKWQTGWGSYSILLDPADVLSGAGFTVSSVNASTGGPSELFTKPAYQRSLSGTTRMAPDIAWLADPFTGGLVEVTMNPSQGPVLQVYGGTGLACTMFSALWSIANQEAGSPLGQAAPYLYSMPKGAITDMLPLHSKTNPVTWIYSSATDRTLVETDYGFVGISAIWNQGGQVNDVFFGDNFFAGPSTPGWDYLSGLGAPNPKPFADFFNPAH